MHQHHPRSMQRSALSATFDFWYAPPPTASTEESTAGGAATPSLSSSQSQQQHPPPLLPAPHAQLFFEDEHPSFVELKGQDHRREEDEEHNDESDEDDDDDILMIECATSNTQVAPTQGPPPPLPHIFGGGSSRRQTAEGGAGARRTSWLLGFARPRSETTIKSMMAMTTTTVKAAENSPTHEGRGGDNKLKTRNDSLLLHSLPPGLVRVPSGSSLDESSSSGSTTSEEDSLSPTSSRSSQQQRSKGVSFSLSVQVQPIPHSSLLSHSQRLRMYTTSDEVRKNKIRNKMEYRHDGYDWRNVSEEWEMGVDMITGELVHPVHEIQQHHFHQRS